VPFPALNDPKRLVYFAGEKIGLLEKGESFNRVLRDRFAPIVDDVAPDLIHAQFGPMGVIMEPIATVCDIPLVVSFHGYDVSVLPKQTRWRRMYRDLFQKGNRFHAVSNYIAERISQLGAQKKDIHVIHNGIRLTTFLNADRMKHKQNDCVQCLHVGRLVEKKAPVHLVKSFRLAQERVPEGIRLTLKIAGDGPMREATEAEINTQRLKEDVDLIGQIPHDSVPELMHESDIYTQHCLTASDGDKEGMGITFAEASAIGLPVVATRHNGIPDVVKHGETGFLVPERDVDEMADRITELARDPQLRNQFGEAGRRHIMQNFRLDQQVAKMKQLYQSILSTA
jgi:glycosyltransferase involved in cell wall biosynthesis